MSHARRSSSSILGVAPLLLASVMALEAQEPCPSSRADVEAEIAAGATGEELYQRYGHCNAGEILAATAPSVPKRVVDKANTFISFNTNWERIESCGYHPQREELQCALEIRRSTGYAGQIGAGPGSHEWVLFCVNFGTGLRPVGLGQVHVHDAGAGAPTPPWDFGVAVQAGSVLAGHLNSGRELQGKAILSWALVPPQDCFWDPLWGQWANFRIRLDP